MKDLGKYVESLREAAHTCVREGIGNLEFITNLRQCDPGTLDELVGFRAEMLSEKDRELATPYLDCNFGRFYGDLDRRLATIMVTLEIGEERTVHDLETRFRPYREDDKLFKSVPWPWSALRDNELVDFGHIAQVDESEVVWIDHSWYALLDWALSPSLVALLHSRFPRSRLFVRLNPSYRYECQPAPQLFEAPIRPADPTWWEELRVYPGKTTGFAYMQDSGDVGTQAYWDYAVRKVRRLEGHVRRSSDGHLSMMIEELTDEHGHCGVLMGRCIHIDSYEPMGRDVSEALANHLDLAINIYRDCAAEERRKSRLDQAEKVDASYRSHLLRIEKVPFEICLLCAERFFRSMTLVQEWTDELCSR